MTFPRLLAEGTSEERRLLNAALTDRPSPGTHAQVLSTLGLGLSVVTTAAPSAANAAPLHTQSTITVHGENTNGSNTSLPPATAPLSFALRPFVQWVGIAGVVLGVGLSTALVAPRLGKTAIVQRSDAPAMTSPTVAPKNTANPESQPVATLAINRVTPASDTVAVTAATLPLPPPKAPTLKPQNAVTVSDSSGLEVRLIDAARQALQSGNASVCLTKLEERKRRVKAGMLEPEATLLRVQAELALGQNAAAERDANRYLRQQPEGPIATRIRSALSHANSEP